MPTPYNAKKQEVCMRYRAAIPLGLLLLSSCSGPEAEAEPDYESMVMIDDYDEWTSEEERNRKVVTADPPDPQELLLIEPLGVVE